MEAWYCAQALWRIISSASKLGDLGHRCSILRMGVVVVVVELVFALGFAIFEELVISMSILPTDILGIAREAKKCACGRNSSKSAPHSRGIILVASVLVILANKRILNSYFVQIVLEQEGGDKQVVIIREVL